MTSYQEINDFWKHFLRNNRLPFAVGQVGHSFRNEISTGNGLIRTREFQMAEIEHFFDPLDDDFEEFQPEMKNLVIPIWTENAQLSGQTLLAIPISGINMVRDPRITSFDDPSIIVVWNVYHDSSKLLVSLDPWIKASPLVSRFWIIIYLNCLNFVNRLE